MQFRNSSRVTNINIIKISLQETLRKQRFHYDAKDLFEPKTKIVCKNSRKLPEETKATAMEDNNKKPCEH